MEQNVASLNRDRTVSQVCPSLLGPVIIMYFMSCMSPRSEDELTNMGFIKCFLHPNCWRTPFFISHISLHIYHAHYIRALHQESVLSITSFIGAMSTTSESSSSIPESPSVDSSFCNHCTHRTIYAHDFDTGTTYHNHTPHGHTKPKTCKNCPECDELQPRSGQSLHSSSRLAPFGIGSWNVFKSKKSRAFRRGGRGRNVEKFVVKYEHDELEVMQETKKRGNLRHVSNIWLARISRQVSGSQFWRQG